MKISINLLPPEIITAELKKAKFYKIQFIGITIILTLIFLTSLTSALQILQSRNLSIVQAKLNQSEQRVLELKGTQASLVLLKDRLNVINKYLGVPSQQSAIYRLVDKLTPTSVSISSFTIDKTGGVTFLALVPDRETLNILLSNLTNKDNNEDKISQVSVESLNRGRDGLYRINLKIKPKS